MRECNYRRNFVEQMEMKIAIIFIGYADGFPRSLSAKGYVLIGDYRMLIMISL